MHDHPRSSDVATFSSAGNSHSGLLRLPGEGFSVWTRRVAVHPSTAQGNGFSLSDRSDTKTLPFRTKTGFSKKKAAQIVTLGKPVLEAPVEENGNRLIRLPGEGFTVWISGKPPLKSVSNARHEVVEPELALSTALASIGSVPPPTAKTPRKTIARKRTFSFLRWAAVFLLACAIAALLDSENHRQRLQSEKTNLLNKNHQLQDEKQDYYDNWQTQERENAQLSTEITQIEGHLSESRSNVLELTAQRNGLTTAIEQLKNTLAMAINDAQSTEASLRKMIAGLEGDNADLSQSLSKERQRLNSLEGKLAEVTQKLADSESNNQRLMEDNATLHSRVASLESSLRQTVENAQAKETALRSELGELKSSNEALAQSLDAQREELLRAKEQLKATEDEVAQKDSKVLSAQATIEDLNTELVEAEQSRDSLTEEKDALLEKIDELNHRMASIETNTDSDLVDQLNVLQSQEAQNAEQVKALESAKGELLAKNHELRDVVADLNGKLTAVIEEGTVRESTLTEKVEQLSESNEQLKQSLETQEHELNELLQKESSVDPLRHDQGQLLNTVNELESSLSESQQKEEALSKQAQAQASEITELNAQVSVANQNLTHAVVVLQEFDLLKTQVEELRAQGETLAEELMQREIHISTLAAENDGWKQEAENLRELLESEREAQDQLQQFVSSLRSKIGGLQK